MESKSGNVLENTRSCQNGGMERVYRLNWLHPEDKWTYRKAGSGDYGAIEIMVGNFIDHFFLDMIGYGVSN